MTLRAYRTFQALILAGVGIYILSKVMDGRILLYINQRFVILVLLAAIGMVVLAQFVLRERPPSQLDEEVPGHNHNDEEPTDRQGWMLWLVAVPLLVGLLVPEKPLGANVLETRGVNLTSGLIVQRGTAKSLEIPSTQRTVLDWIRIANEESSHASLEGQPADVTGFVYHDPRLGSSQFMVSRFSIACCVADAFALGMVVDWPDAAALPDNQWVRVRGRVHLLDLEGKKLPAIAAQEVQLIPEPVQPYLFP